MRPKSYREPPIPSNTIAWFVREALRRTWVSKRTSFVAILMISISLLLVGAFMLVAENLSRAATRWQNASKIVVYLDPAATDEQTRNVDRFLASERQLASRRLVTREEAMQRFRRDFANMNEILDQLEGNPFPPSFEITVDPLLADSPAFSRTMTQLKTLAGVDQVQYDWEWLARLRRLVALINVVGLITGGVLAIAAAFTIANVIRLTMMLYREEIEIMRLVGATERMIRGPFLIEGILQGTLGGLLSVGALYLSFELARRSLAPNASMLWSFLFAGFLPWPKIAALVAGGMAAGWLGSWLSVREEVAE